MTSLPSLAFNLTELSDKANWAIPLLGVMLITMGLMMGIRKKRRRPGVSKSAREHVEELRQKQAVRGDLEQLMTEVEQLAKRFGAQLDAKSMHMERLLEEADHRIAELKQLQEARRAAEALRDTDTSSLKPQTSSLNPPSPAPDPDTALKRSVCALADRGLDPVEIANQLNEHVGKIELILALRKT